MKDRIEHTEHKARRNGDLTTDADNWRFGERRYGGTGSRSANGDGRSVAAASTEGEAEA